jgi:beta-glucanase (GH16 family)
MPKGKSLWPAFWLLPVDQEWPPEIDVFEVLGHKTHTVYMTNHWGTKPKYMSSQQGYSGPDFAKKFHRFAIEWNPGEIIWTIDGVERFRSKQGVPAEPMYLLANLAVGGEWPGNPDASTPFPSYLEIDYIRVYQRSYGYRFWLPIILNKSSS